MHLVNIFWISLLSSLIFLGCQHHDPWKNVNIKTGSSKFDSAKLVYPATNFCYDLELEFLYTASKLYAYINVYTNPIAPYEGDHQVAKLIIDVKGAHYEELVDRLSGGQRLKLPEETLALLVDLLSQHSYIILTLGDSYKTKIPGKDFKKHYKLLQSKHLSFMSNHPIGLAI